MPVLESLRQLTTPTDGVLLLLAASAFATAMTESGRVDELRLLLNPAVWDSGR